MSREIKFRFWLPDFGRFADKFHDGNYWNVEDWISSDTKNHVIPQQFTGLTDKSGKEIYEGDFVKCGEFKPVEVKYDNYLGGFLPFVLRLDEEKQKLAMNPEIIGNIFENPDLLK